MKAKLLFEIFMTLVFFGIGFYFINDWKIALGVFIMIWGNNIGRSK